MLSCKLLNSSALILPVLNPTLKTLMIERRIKYCLDHALLTVFPGLILAITSNFSPGCVCTCVCMCVCFREKHQCPMAPFHNRECVKGKEFGGTSLLPVGHQLDRCF